MAGRAKENIPGGSLKYLFVYSKIRIFKCSYRVYIYTHLYPCRKERNLKAIHYIILYIYIFKIYNIYIHMWLCSYQSCSVYKKASRINPDTRSGYPRHTRSSCHLHGLYHGHVKGPSVQQHCETWHNRPTNTGMNGWFMTGKLVNTTIPANL